MKYFKDLVAVYIILLKWVVIFVALGIYIMVITPLMPSQVRNMLFIIANYIKIGSEMLPSAMEKAE